MVDIRHHPNLFDIFWPIAKNRDVLPAWCQPWLFLQPLHVDHWGYHFGKCYIHRHQTWPAKSLNEPWNFSWESSNGECSIAALRNKIWCEHHLHASPDCAQRVIKFSSLLELDKDMNLKRCRTWSLTVCFTVKSKNHCATLDFVHGGSRNFQSCQIACAAPRMSFERKHRGPKENKIVYIYMYINVPSFYHSFIPGQDYPCLIQ